MKLRLDVVAIMTLCTGIAATLIWLRAPDAVTTAAPPAPAIAIAPRLPVAGPVPVRQVAVAPAAPTLVIPAFSSSAEREQSVEQRRAALPVFLKAADEGITQLQGDIELARAHGAPSNEISEKEQRLHDMQQARQQVLARNYDIAS